jgi:hypothetical protein
MTLRNTSHDSPKDYKQNTQAYGTIIVAFHLEVFQGIIIYIFLKEGNVFISSNDIDMITCLHDGPYDRGKIGITRIVDTHLGQPQG